ncbi:MAG: outer membrane beta-barrel protein [Candidatus Eisenbacteria bacterium]
MKTLDRFALVALCGACLSLATAAHAARFHPALELEGGAGTITFSADEGTDGVHPKFGPSFGVGVTVGADPAARFAVRTGAFYRHSRSRWEFDGSSYPAAYRTTTRLSTLRVPVRVSFAPAAAGHWRLEGGVTGRWLFKATRDLEMSDAIPLRPEHADAVIFESLGGEADVTDRTRRGDVLLSVGAGWHGVIAGHDTGCTARFEQGLYDLALDEPTRHMSDRSIQLGLSIGWSVAD